jgi:hypothetical protein
VSLHGAACRQVRNLAEPRERARKPPIPRISASRAGRRLILSSLCMRGNRENRWASEDPAVNGDMREC